MENEARLETMRDVAKLHGWHEIAKHLRCTLHLARYWHEQYEMPVYRVGHFGVFADKEELWKWVKEHKRDRLERRVVPYLVDRGMTITTDTLMRRATNKPIRVVRRAMMELVASGDLELIEHPIAYKQPGVYRLAKHHRDGLRLQ